MYTAVKDIPMKAHYIFTQNFSLNLDAVTAASFLGIPAA
jgi:hypothetical protein